MSWVQIPFPAPSRHLDDLAVTGALRWPTTSLSCFASGRWPPRSDAARGLVGSNPISRSLPTARRSRCDWRPALAHDRRTTHGRARRCAPSVVSPARLSPCRRARAAGRRALNDRPPLSGGAPVHGKWRARSASRAPTRARLRRPDRAISDDDRGLRRQGGRRSWCLHALRITIIENLHSCGVASGATHRKRVALLTVLC